MPPICYRQTCNLIAMLWLLLQRHAVNSFRTTLTMTGETGRKTRTRQSYITLRPRSALPSPPSRPIPFAANVLQCIVSGGENRLKLPLTLGYFVTLPADDRATAIGNVHRKIGKDRACGSESGNILVDRQTHIQTDVVITILRQIK